LDDAINGDLKPPTEEQAARFEMLRPMIASAHKEIGELSKKKQDGIVNDLKVRHINRLLAPVKEILADDPSADYLELLDEETLPQNSDAVFVLGQFLAAMDQYKGRHTKGNFGRWRTVEWIAKREEEYDDEEYEDEE
jgi:hypothetical protein